jgi:ATP-dependent Clp protease ATP-binding subunit ClpA
MMAGCIDEPETRALERTMKQYSIGKTWRDVQDTLQEMYTTSNSNSEEGNNQGWLAGFASAKNKNDGDRPFSRELKQTFLQASKLADQMGSTRVQSPHVFLALLEYKEENKKGSSGPTAATAATIGGKDDDVGTSCSAWALLVKMKTFDATQISALDICQSLLSNMKQEADNNNVGNGRELVTGAGGASSSSSTPTLSECGTDLTQLAADGLLDPVHGRDAEIRSCLRTLIRRRKNNVCLIGDAGVGKTAIAEGVAQILVDPVACPTRLRAHRLVSLDLASLVAGTKYRGEFEERLQAIVKEVTNPKASVRTILFLDEMHNLVGAGAAEGGMDAANLLKPALARGECQIMGATTISEYRKYIEKDAAVRYVFVAYFFDLVC